MNEPPCKECISYAMCNARLRDRIQKIYEKTTEYDKLSKDFGNVIVGAYYSIEALSHCPMLSEHIIAIHESKHKQKRRIPDETISKCLFKCFNIKSKDLIQ